MGKVERIHTVTDSATGEVISEQKNVINIRPMEPEPNYIKLYVDDIGRIYNLQAGHQVILGYIAASVDYEGIVSLSMGRKVRIAHSAKCTVKSVDNAIGECVKHNILHRIGRGEYELDPRIFGKGEWRNIRERRMSFKATITYSPDKGRQVEMQAVREDDTSQQSLDLNS